MDMLSGKKRVSLIVISYPFNQWYLATGLTNETELLKRELEILEAQNGTQGPPGPPGPPSHKEKQGRKGIGVLRGCLGQKEKTANKD